MNTRRSKALSRRDFLKLAGGMAGGMALTTFLSSCQGGSAPATPASTSAAPTSGVPLTGAEATSTLPAPTTGAPAANAGGGFELRLWTFNDPGWIKGSEEIIKNWGTVHPEIKIKHEFFPYEELQPTIQTAMAAKNEADLIEMFGTWVHAYIKGKTISETPGDILTLDQAKQMFYQAPLDGFALDGKLYGMPHEFNLENGGVLVNQQMFTEDNLKAPPAWTNWDEVISDAKKLTRMDGATMTRAGFNFVNQDGLTFWLWEGILERGADYFADDKIHLNLTTPQAEETVQWMLDLVQTHKVVDANQFNFDIADVQDTFFQRLAAIGFRGPWVVPGGRVNYPDFTDPWSYESIPPLFGDKYNFAADSGWGLVVSPNSPHQLEAWQFAKFSTTEKDNARVWNVSSGTVPALKEVAEDPGLLNDLDWLGPSLKILPFGRFVGDLQDRDTIWYNISSATILTVLQGQLGVKEALEKINKEANDTIDTKLKGGS